MSLAETQQIMQVLQEIMALLNNVEIKTTKLSSEMPQTREALTTFRQLERLALRWLALGRQMGLPDDVNGAINKIMQLIVMIRMVQMSMNMMMLGNPVTAAIGVAGLIGSAATLPSLLEGY